MELELLFYEDQDLPKGWSPYYVYAIKVNNVEVGRLTFREGTIEQHYIDGHIGYSIEEKYQGHHYSKDACLLLFKELKYKEVIITCDPDNIASKKIILSLGGEYLETKEIPKNMRSSFNKDEKVKEIYKVQVR